MLRFEIVYLVTFLCLPRVAYKLHSWQAIIGRLRLGNLGGCKPVGGGVHELVVDSGPGYRIYFGTQGDELIMLLCAGTKRRQQPDIDLAKEYWAAYKKSLRIKGKDKAR